MIKISKICLKQIKFGKSTNFFYKILEFFFVLQCKQRKKITIEIVDGREERTMNNLWTFTNCTFWTSFQTQRNWKNSCRGIVLFPFYSYQYSVTELHSSFLPTYLQQWRRVLWQTSYLRVLSKSEVIFDCLILNFKRNSWVLMGTVKVIMQGKLIADAYALRAYWN